MYFAEGVVDTRYYGIPCKPLPTADSLWVNERIDAPPEIDRPVLIRAGNLSGFEFGAGPLNPYEQFAQLKPTHVIHYGVFVFEGHFKISLAASVTHTQRAQGLLQAKQLREGLAEAQQAVALAPNAVNPNVVAGDILSAMGRPEHARPYHLNVLTYAKTIAPEFQVGWVEGLEKKLAVQETSKIGPPGDLGNRGVRSGECFPPSHASGVHIQSSRKKANYPF